MPMLFLFASLLLASPIRICQQSATPDRSSRTAVSTGRDSGIRPEPGDLEVDPSEGLRVLYEGSFLSSDFSRLAGGALVLDPGGTPHAGADVVLVRGADTWPWNEVLEHALSGRDGRADLSLLSLADRVVFWAPGLPATVVEGDLLTEHRRLAKRGPVLLRLDRSDVVTGRFTLDGVPIGKEAVERLQVSVSYPWSRSDWPAIRGNLERALLELHPPGRMPRFRVDETGAFTVDGLRWPMSFGHRPLAEALRWGPRDIFLAELPEGETPTRAHLRCAWLAKQEAPITVRLVHGAWIVGRVEGGALGSLDHPMRLRFAPPGAEQEEEQVEVHPDGSFRFALPLPFPDLDLEVLLDLNGSEIPNDYTLDRSNAEVKHLQTFSFDAPSGDVGRAWDLGTLRLDLDGLRLLRVRDAEGRPVEGASAFLLDSLQAEKLPPAPRRGELFEAWPPPSLSGKRGRLFVRVPGEGEELWVAHPLYERARVKNLVSSDGSIEVVLRRAALLRLHARLPEGSEAAVLPCPLFAQAEADRPAWVLHRGDRPTRGEVARSPRNAEIVAQRIDARSEARWSFTTRFLGAAARQDARFPRSLARLPLQVVPGVPFHLRVFDPVGKVFFEGDLPGFAPGETRELGVDIAGPFFSVEGQLRLADGSPAAGLEVSFGRFAPVLLTKTDPAGRFRIEGLSGLEGELLVERSSTWIECFGAGGSKRGRESTALLLRHDFHFDPDAPTLLRLPAPADLEVVPVEESGLPSRAAWCLDLYTDPGGVFLDGYDPEHVVAKLGFDGMRRLSRPPGVAAHLVLSAGGTVIERDVPSSENHIEIPVTSPGTLVVDLSGLAVEQVLGWYELTPLDAGSLVVRWVGAPPVDRLDDLPPGRYLLRVFHRAIPRGRAKRVGGPREVTVVPGGVTRVEL